MLTSLGVILIGIWLIVEHQKLPDPTLALVFGIIAAVLALLDLIWPHVRGRAVP